MPDRPTAEIAIDEPLIRRLLTAQAPEVADLPLAYAADGWDSSVWRLGDRRAVRLPRRAVAAPLVLGEQRHLPAIAARLSPTGVGVPAPTLSGTPTEFYPWHWSIVPWFDGEPGMRVPRADRSGWVGPLAAALSALHVPAEGEFPLNPVRGVPFADRATVVAERFAILRATETVAECDVQVLESLWRDCLNSAPWIGPPTWIHGDLHPGNIVARAGQLVALIDFGDLTAGDPAYDLGIAWLAFDRPAREDFEAALRSHYDPATWTRALGWAAADVLMFLLHTDDDPEYAAFGREALAALVE